MSFPALRSPYISFKSNSVGSVTDVSLSDTGSGVESLAITTTVNLNDPSSAAEAVTILTQLALTDTPVASDAVVVLTELAISDSGTLSAEAIDSLATIVSSDSMTAAEAFDLLVQIALTDLPVAADALSVLSSLSESENNRTFFANESMINPPTTGSLGGDAVHDDTNDYLRLTTAANDRNGWMGYSQSLPSDFIVEFEGWAGGGNGADGICFYFGTTTDTGNEETADGGYRIYFSEYNNLIGIRFNGTIVGSVTFNNLGNSTWRRFKIVKTGDNFKIYINEALQLDYTDSTRTLSGSKFGIGARTGGLNNEHRIRSFMVYKFGEASETVSVAVPVAITDSANITSELVILLVQMVMAESLFATEALAILTELATNDSGVLADAATVHVPISADDFAVSAGESVSALAIIAQSDTGLSSEALNLLAQVAISESPGATDAASVLVALSATDSGLSAEVIQCLVQLALSDTTGSVEAVSMLALISLTEPSSGVDSLSALTQLALSDVGVSTDAVDALVHLSLSDSTVSTDALTILYFIAISDATIAAEVIAVASFGGLFNPGAQLYNKSSIALAQGQQISSRGQSLYNAVIAGLYNKN